MTEQKLVTGVKCGHLILRGKMRQTDKNPKPRWRCECICGTTIIVPQQYLLRKPNPKTHCGCQSKSLRTIYNREYRIWTMMRMRCNDPTHVSYKDYGGRGIKVFSEWNILESGFEPFFEHIGPAPTDKHTLDRINNDKGYEPGNVRWATPKEQRANQRPRTTSK